MDALRICGGRHLYELGDTGEGKFVGPSGLEAECGISLRSVVRVGSLVAWGDLLHGGMLDGGDEMDGRRLEASSQTSV